MLERNFSLRSALFLGAATAAALSMSATAYAQDAKETVVVTGSRIPQLGIVSPSPVAMVSSQELKLQGTSDVGTLMNTLPSVFAGQTSGQGNASSGTITVDLRGLGADRTLVLIDGKRLGPGDAEVPVPDLNQIPAALIDRTEVLTGGASAVYGSDAVAGVVNFIMRKDFQGVQVDFNMGAYQHNNGNSYLRGLQDDAGFQKAPSDVFDGSSYDLTVILGANSANNKGNVTAYLGYQRQNQVLQGARDISACSLSNISTGTVNGKKQYSKLYCAGSFNYDTFYSTTGAGAGTTFFMEPGGKLVPFTGASDQYFNYGAYNSLIRPQTRWNGGAFAHYEIDPMLDVYANFMFMDTHNSWQAAPSGLFWLSANGPSGMVEYSCDNPLMSGTDFQKQFCPNGDATGTAVVASARRNVEGGPRVTDFRHTSYRMVIGAKGTLWDGWTYDASAQEGLTLYQQLYLQDWSKQAATNSFLTDGSGNCLSGTCADVFHGIGGLTDDMEKALYSHGQRTGYTEEQVLSATVTGDLGQYGVKSPWANAGVGVSGGAEYRKETLEETTSVADYSGDLFGAGSAALGQPKKTVSNWELFGEVRIPIITGQKFIEDLSINGGYRYSSYNTSGAKAVHSYKYGLEYQPIDDFRLRASVQRAVRAPGILELYPPQNVVLGSYTDPCAGTTPSGTAAQCALTGVTPAQYGHILQCAANQCNYLTGGNEALKPEKSNTRSFGIVITPTFMPGFTFTADYFNIDVKDYVGTVPQTVVLSQCMSGANPAVCSAIHRAPNGNLSVNTGKMATSGYIVGTLTNTGYLHTKGVDLEANYLASLSDFGLGDIGSISVNVFGTFVSDYLVQPYTGADVNGIKDYNCVGLFGVSCGSPTPSWRHKARITWQTPWDLGLSFNWRHISGAKFDGNSSNPYITQTDYSILPGGGGKIASYDYLDFAFTYDVSSSIQLSGGVNNVFDKNPPILAAGGKTSAPTGPLNGNTLNGIYDSLGRYMFLGITIKE